MNMRERIARVIEAHHPDGSDMAGSGEVADAVLDAMREPTEEMVLDAVDAWHKSDKVALDDVIIADWQALIDAAKNGA